MAIGSGPMGRIIPVHLDLSKAYDNNFKSALVSVPVSLRRTDSVHLNGIVHASGATMAPEKSQTPSNQCPDLGNAFCLTL
jgi:hypothetical protein